MERVERPGSRSRRVVLPRLLAICLAAGAGLGASGCRVNEDDIHRWESTLHGPEKLRAVVLHDKYETPLRVEAALSLVRMKPRQGRHIGIGVLVDTLAAVGPEARYAITASLVPALVAELRKPPPVGQAGQPAPPDGSYPYKDAAYAILTSERTVLVADEQLKTNLRSALVDWAMADFEHRLENRTQGFGMEQLLRFIGPEAVVGMPKLMTRDAKRLDQMAGMVAELGNAATKEAGSTALVQVASYVTSEEWVKVKKPELQAANAASSKEVIDEKRFELQLAQYRDEELFRVFGSMKKLGGRPSVGFLLTFAENAKESDKRRQAALAALEGRLDRNHPDDVKRILRIASTDAPDVVLDQTFRRIGEMPRELVVADLYELFKSEKWKIRRAAAATVLRMSTVKHVDEFMSRLPDGPAKGFAMGEALAYGAFFGDLKGGSPLEAIQKHLHSKSPAARTSALGYYFANGTAADLPALQAHESDNAKAPVCDADPDCRWVCEVPKASDPKERELRDVTTIGEFVRYCVEPEMRQRKPGEAKEAPSDAPPAVPAVPVAEEKK